MSAEQIPQQTPPGGGPRGRYAKSEAVRESILVACIEAFSVSGFHGSTMKDIAQRAGISQTGLIHHFPDKAALLVEVLKERDLQMSSIMRSTDQHDFFHAQLDVVRDNALRPGLLQLHTTISAEATDAEHPAHELYRERYDNLRTYLTALFEMHQAKGLLRVDASPRALASLFVAALDGLQLQWLYHPEEVDVAESLQALVDALLKGIY
ncbi:TetR/AcrR family transcriptional regulator [Microbacterium sp. X-17]|uniref:TetR/AcrR family transcriptional regulator n=1 Tax=Microbacterium sp. X-17 TaxID=3144404 RepID=UPI0031F50CC0